MKHRSSGPEIGSRPRRLATHAWLACLTTAALLAACGSDEPAPAPPTPAPQPAPKVEKAPEDPTAKMARAVATSGGSAPINVRYEIPNKPIVNQPVEMDLVVLVSTGADSLALVFEPSLGLTVISEPPPVQEDVEPGVPVMAKLAVSAEEPDVFYVTVAATIQSAGVPTTRSFAIPLIFSEAPAPAPESVEQPESTTAEAPAK
jgi:hypothetical protein